MQNEDDLRGLAKVMDFMRAISILFAVINIYWFCYQSFRQWGINIGVVDKILLNFQRTAGLFSNILYTKLFSVVFLALSCLGTKGVKEEKITWNKIYVFLTIGFILFFLNWWLLVLPLPLAANTGLYIFTMIAGYLSLLAAGVWISRLLKSKYSINSLVYWVTYVHNVVYSFYRSMIYCYINSTQRCAGSIVIDIIPTNGADKRKFFPFAPYFPVTNVIKRYFYPYFPAIIGIKGYSFPYFPYLSGIMKIKTALYSLFSRLDWHKTVVFPCLGEIYEGIRSLSWEIPVT